MNIRNILIVAATHAEIAPLLTELNAGDIPAGRVRSLQWKQLPLDVLITGPGMVATAFFLGKVRGLHEYSLVLNAGIAGSFTKKISRGCCVQVDSDCFADLGSLQAGTLEPMYAMPMAKDYIPAGLDASNVITNPQAPSLAALADLPRVSGITVNTLTGRRPKNNRKPDIETMEGAAFFMACRAVGAQCLQLRAISNYIGVKDETDWDLPGAVAALHQTLQEILHEL